MFINGVAVDFPAPYKPYPAQIAIMSKAIQALKGSHNALLESPTGSGKSMALLCSVLAWAVSAVNDADAEEDGTSGADADADPSRPSEADVPSDEEADFEEDVFAKYAFKNVQTSSAPSVVNQNVSSQSACNEPIDDPATVVTQQTSAKPESSAARSGKLRPKIFYASRTHSQLEQVVRELRKTPYRPQMDILGSRKHYCINDRVRSEPNLNDLCRQLTDTMSCKFYGKGTKRLARSPLLRRGGALETWDIEDLCELGRDMHTCPYFASKAMLPSCDLILCPYNYLLDPLIRKSMGITLSARRSVVILDEAHNIEDISRDAGSCEIQLDDVTTAVTELEGLMQQHSQAAVMGAPLLNVLYRIRDWMVSLFDAQLESEGLGVASNSWCGEPMLKVLENEMGIYAEYFQNVLLKSLQEMDEYDNDVMQRKTGVDEEAHAEDKYWKFGGKTSAVLWALFVVLELVFKNDGSNIDGYALAYKRRVRRTQKGRKGSGRKRRKANAGTLAESWDDAARVAATPFEATLCLWCMDPGIVFGDLERSTRSILLASGTLTPLNSFASELNSSFSIRLEAPHVINKAKQLRVLSVSAHQGMQLLGNHKALDSFQFQDSVGDCISNIIRTVPNGVLCFFPSYGAMEKLTQRWKTTGLWGHVSDVKPIFREERGSGDDFEKMIADYKSASSSESGDRGALLLAVCRGKVSEGIDFSDHTARAVILVGIPYANMFDKSVSLKISFNDSHSGSRGLLKGKDWYQQQAFRCLNQALGRCIRHRDDFGAIIFLDSRYRWPRNVGMLSKWVRSSLGNCDTVDEAVNILSTFYKTHENQEM